MSDDIVTRLRDRAEERQEALDEYWRGHKFDYDFPMLESQAADEIERLRAEVSRLMQIICDSSPDDDFFLVRQEADAIWEQIHKNNQGA